MKKIKIFGWVIFMTGVAIVLTQLISLTIAEQGLLIGVPVAILLYALLTLLFSAILMHMEQLFE